MYRRFAVLVVLIMTAQRLPAEVPPGSSMPMPAPMAHATGTVSAVSGTMITLFNALTIDTTGAVFQNRNGNASIADVRVGAQVTIMIREAEAIPPRASHVTIQDPYGYLSGRVQAVDLAGSSVTVLGTRVLITSNTRIHDGFSRGDSGKTIADIKVGKSVTMDLGTGAAPLTAQSVHIMPPTPNWFASGKIKSMSGSAWVITRNGDNADVTVSITEETRLAPNLRVGDEVHVSGIADASGLVVALTIYANHPVPMPTPTPVPLLSGAVKSIGATEWVITLSNGSDLRVRVDQNTKIEAGIKAGDAVVLTGERNSSGEFVATAIMKAVSRTRPTRH